MADKKPVGAILIELDHVAVDGYNLRFEALKAALKPHKIALDNAMYRRADRGRGVQATVSRLLRGEADTVRVDDVVDAGGKALQEALANGVKLRDVLDSILKSAKKHDWPVGALSGFTKPVSALVASAASIPVDRLQLIREAGVGVPTNDDWTDALKKVGAQSGHAVVVCGSSTGARAAVAAGLRCVAVPTPELAVGDFCGVDRVVEGKSDIGKEIESLLQ